MTHTLEIEVNQELSEEEIEALQDVAEAIPEMTEQELGYILGLAEGVKVRSKFRN